MTGGAPSLRSLQGWEYRHRCLLEIEILKVKTKSLPPILSQTKVKEPGLSDVDGMGTRYNGKRARSKAWARRLLDLEYH
jgi:hypothetical protein